MKKKLIVIVALIMMSAGMSAGSLLIKIEHTCHYQNGWPFSMRDELRANTQYETQPSFSEDSNSIFCGSQTYNVYEVIPLEWSIILNVGFWLVVVSIFYLLFKLVQRKLVKRVTKKTTNNRVQE